MEPHIVGWHGEPRPRPMDMPAPRHKELMLDRFTVREVLTLLNLFWQFRKATAEYEREHRA